MKLSNYYIIFDLEATCNEHDKFLDDSLDKQIIEIGAVKVTPEFDVLDSFTQIVGLQGRSLPGTIEISPYCTKLTGIEQAHVDIASDFGSVYADFIKWSELPLQWMSWGNDYDLLKLECDRRAIKPFNLKRFYDLREIVRFMRGTPASAIKNEISKYNINIDSLMRHAALDDCVIEAKVLKEVHIRSRGWIR